MKNEDFEDKAIKAYLSVMDQEAAHPQVAKDKKAFLAKHFRPQPVWMPALPVLVPAMAMALCAFIYFNYFAPSLKMSVKQEAPAPAAAVQAEPVTAAPVQLDLPEPLKKKKFFRIPRIWVKKVTSDIGQPMVYQKQMNKVPVTIIWVFTPEQQQQQVLTKPTQPGIAA